MKNILQNFLSVVFLFTMLGVHAQDFQGKAVYQSKTKVEMDLSASGIPADRIKMIEERMKSQFDRTYILSFNKTASIYKQEAKLDQPARGGGGMRMMFAGGAGNGKAYKNTQAKTFANENEFSGKNFLIKGDLTSYDWKMEEETKMIGQNLCFKATTVIQRPAAQEFRFGRGRGNNNSDEETEENQEPVMEDVIVTAWYTLDIPVNHGPGDYWGLPGLILEVNDGTTIILCTKIVMNPKEKVEISEPKKGKVVSQEEYDEIMEEKLKEMRERMGNERQKGGSQRVIRIGG